MAPVRAGDHDVTVTAACTWLGAPCGVCFTTVSPAWLAWAGAVPALELFDGLEVADARAHDAGLADAVLEGLGLAPAGRAVVTVPDRDGSALARLGDAGVTAVARAGAVRLSFHLWDDGADVGSVLGALRG